MPAQTPIFMKPRMFVVLLLGFSSGLPLALTGGTLQAWLTDAGIALPVIGRFALVGIPYTIKFLWAPLLDECRPPLLGRRRGWGLLSQLCLILAIIGLGCCSPADNLALVVGLSFLIVFFSATQDIILDALRTEMLDESEYGAGAGVYVMGYRIAMLISGALALYLADGVDGLGMNWGTVYWLMASFMSIGVLAVLFSPEPSAGELAIAAPPTMRLRDRVILPFLEFFHRPASVSILSFVTVYKLSTMMATALTVTFLMSIGYSKTEIGTVSKVYGLIATILGTLAGGALMTKISLKKALWIFGVIQSLAGLSFLLLTVLPKNTFMLILVLATENFMIGLGVAALSAFMMSICSKQFTGSQFALLSSLSAVSRVVLVSQAGEIANTFGWSAFYIFSVLLAIPGLLLLTQFDKWVAESPPDTTPRMTVVDYVTIGAFVGGLVLISLEPLIALIPLVHSSSSLVAQAGALLFGAALVLGYVKERRTGAGGAG